MIRPMTRRQAEPEPGRSPWTALSGVALTLGVGALILSMIRRRSGQHGRGRPGPLELEARTVVQVDPDTAYAEWRRFESLPKYLPHLQSVTPTAEGLYRWTTAAPVTGSVSWEAEVTGDEPGRRISWRSLPGSEIDNSGTVHFAPAAGGTGTEVKVVLHYDVPGGRLGKAVAGLFGEDPEQQVRDALDQFRRALEAGSATGSST